MDGVRLIPVELVDCAGLVPDAWQGRGLGNQFLDEIRRADALIHVVDAAGATDVEGKMVRPGSHDPVEDVRFLEKEITMWMAQILRRDWLRLARTVESGSKDLVATLEERLSGLAIKRNHILEALRRTDLKPEKPTSWSDIDFLNFIDALRRSSKPMLIAANKIDLPTAEENLERLKELGYTVVPCCAEAELALRRAAEKGFVDYKPGDSNLRILMPEKVSKAQNEALSLIQERILRRFGNAGVQEAINMAFFKLLNAIVVYTVEDIEKLSDHYGRVLPDARIIPRGTTARELAYIVHTEIGESFIYAVEARDKRRLGEDHILEDGDVVSIVSAKRRA